MENDIKNKIVIGVTGYVGSGKTLFCEIIENAYQCKILYTDNIAKDIIKNDNKFLYLRDRKGDILSDIEINKVKNELHPIVWKHVYDIINNDNDTKLYIIETALPSVPFFDICDKTILIQNDIDIKTDLLKIKRDYNDNIINAILKSQSYYKDSYNKCDYTIDNNSTKNDFEHKIFDILNKILI